MNSDFLNKDLRNEYEKIKAIIKSEGEKSLANWKRYTSKEMPEEERKIYKSKIDKLSNRALADFEEGDTSVMMFEFYRKAYKYDQRNIVLLGGYFSEDHLFILAARNNSMSIIEVGLKKLNERDENYDPRDTILSLTILYNCLKKMNINPRNYFQEKSKLVDNWLSEIMEQYLTREENINTFQAMGYTEIDKPKFGLIWTG
jgi:hypothetical protein